MEPWLERFARANFRRSADTAHDLKTPLNVAVLNLELLRMRLRKIAGSDDPKVDEHTRAIETELRRMGGIFDAFFLLSTPPAGEPPRSVDAGAAARRAAEAAGFPLPGQDALPVQAHPSRIGEMFRLFFAAAGKLLAPAGRSVRLRGAEGKLVLEVSGPLSGETETGRLFKFYYSDREGNPDLSLAVARLIAETYGGELTAEETGDGVVLRLSLPLGER